MADKSPIEWTDATWNIITGCSMVSAGCTNCYAMGLAGSRLRNHPSRAGLTRETGGRSVWTGEVRFNEGWLYQPLRWKRPRRIFVCAHGDLFHEAVPDEWIDRVFAVMALCPQHTFQVLTKRPERMREYVTALGQPGALDIFVRGGGRLLRAAENATRNIGRLSFDPVRQWPLPNVWLGTSIEDQVTADARIPHLLATPAEIRFASAEPLLGRLDLTRCGTLSSVQTCFPDLARDIARHMLPSKLSGTQIQAVGSPWQATTYYQTPDHMGGFEVGSRKYPRLDLVIVGGESGPRARPMHPDWVRSLRDQCVDAGVAFFFKQWGEWGPTKNCGDVITGCRANATWWNEEWLFCETNMADPEADWSDEPDLYRIGKRAAGRLLDGRIWDEMPKITAVQ